MVKQRSRVERIWDAVMGRDQKPTPKASWPTGHYNNIFAVSFNGEKNLGEMGPIRDYAIDYAGLSARSWQAMLESEIAKTVLDKFTLWIVSKGLKLQCNPNKIVLRSEGIDIDSESFNDLVEARFEIWAKSTAADFAGMRNLHNLAQRAYKNSKVSGDVLVILRYINDRVCVQIIDGANVCSPVYGSDAFSEKLSNGNVIRNGIEINSEGEHIAFYVKDKYYKNIRIQAKSESSGLVQAFMVYGNEYRIDNTRGLPLIASCLETMKKIERYKEATVGSAEERAKIVFQIVHDQHSTGESPITKQMARAFNADATEDLPKDINGTELANTVAATTNKSTYNMPVGSELKALESDNELKFKEFYQTNADIICASVGIPPNVAFSMYNDSFSASRAATKDWEHTISVNREDFCAQFYQHIYNYWLHIEILKNRISAIGYWKAFLAKNYMAVEAYRNARFVGPMFPHIDPLKEVNAERLKLGALGANLPLTTLEQATEVLNGGESDSNLEQFAQELEMGKKLKLVNQVSAAT